MPDESPRLDRLRITAEVILISLSCLAPWAFGSVEEWAQLILISGILLLAVVQLAIGWLSREPRSALYFSMPSLALAGLMLLTLAQAYPLPGGLSRWIGPEIGRSRSALVSDRPQALIDPAVPAVDPPVLGASLEPESSRHLVAQVAAIWILFQCAAALGPSAARLRRFGLAVALNGTVLSLFSLIQALTWDGKIYGFRASPISNRWYTGGPFVCHNHLAAYLNLGLGFGLGALVASLQTGSSDRGRRGGTKGDRIGSVWILYCVAVILAGLIATHSRGGFLAMLSATGITFLVLRPRTVRLHFGLLAIVLVVPIFLVAIGTDSPFQRLASMSEAGETGLNGRTAIWLASLRTWLDRPLFGAGMGTFEVALAPALDRDLGVSYQHAENEYLEMAVEGGLTGLLLFLILVGGVAASGYRALARASSTTDRAWVLGAIFGLIALAVQSMGDFPLHIPGITITAVILAAFLGGLARKSGKEHAAARAPAARRFRAPALSDFVLCGLALALFVHEYGFARAEAALSGAGFPMSGAAIPGNSQGPESLLELEAAREGLGRALAIRPDNYAARFQLGLVEMKLYSLDARELLESEQAEAGREEEDPEGAAMQADPLWLLGAVHSASADELEGTGGLLGHAPIRDHLIPAARSFLEARRCSPFRATAHAHLASVDYLLDPREDARVHVERALKLAGPNSHVLALAGVVSVQVGAIDLAADCWRRSLLTGIGDWREIADMAREVLTPDEILDRVIPPGRNYEIWFADYLYTSPEDAEIRAKFLTASLERVPGNPELTPAERAWLQGQASARLDEREQSRKYMQTALSLEPRTSQWRLEYVTWLMTWEQLKEAHTQARIGVELDPYHAGLRNALAMAVDAMARGAPGSDAARSANDSPGRTQAEVTTRLGTRP